MNTGLTKMNDYQEKRKTNLTCFYEGNESVAAPLPIFDGINGFVFLSSSIYNM